MEIKRKIFVFVWCILSFVGILLCDYNYTAIGLLFLGFHTPRDAIFYAVYFERFSDTPELSQVFIIELLIFAFFIVIALLRIKKSMLFEKLVLADNFISLVAMTAIAIMNKGEFDLYHLWFLLLVENIIAIVLFVLYKKRPNAIDSLKFSNLFGEIK